MVVNTDIINTLIHLFGGLLIGGFFVGYAMLFRKLTMKKRMLLSGISATGLFIGMNCFSYPDWPDKVQLICVTPLLFVLVSGYMLGIYLHFKKMHKHYLKLKQDHVDNWSVKMYERLFVSDDEFM